MPPDSSPTRGFFRIFCIPFFVVKHFFVEPLYNGNISQTFWRTASDNIQRSYGYVYDPVNRLLDAHYKIPNSSVMGSYNEHLTYDNNGNILTLKRNGLQESEQQLFQIDDLDYEYQGNQLLNVTDATVAARLHLVASCLKLKP